MRHSLEFTVFPRTFMTRKVVDDDHRRSDNPPATNGHDGDVMRRNEAHNLILQDQIDESAMEERVARIEADVKNIQLDMREFRTDMKAANEATMELKVAVATIDGKINSLSQKIDAQIAALVQRMDARFAALVAKLDTRADAADVKLLDTKLSSLGSRVDGLDAKLEDTREKLGQIGKDVAGLRGMVKAILWVLAGLVGLVMLIPAGFTIAKALHWI
jgi:chromosome segregation ATPase